MSVVYLNGEYLRAEQAKISPMDRGFLFGDGIYEVIPSFDGQFVGFAPHIKRMLNGLAELEIQHQLSLEKWREICEQLVKKNGAGNLAVYLHVSRGVHQKRQHGYPTDITATVFAYTFEIPAPPTSDPQLAKTYKVASLTDLRWQRCNIKSTALLGNVMHYQQAVKQGCDETLLFNEQDELTEASSCNVFVVKDKVVYTPALNHELLPGITRGMLIDILENHSQIEVKQQTVTKEFVQQADEIWLASSTKQIGPVVEVDGQKVANGEIGELWPIAQQLFSKHKFDFNQ